MLKQYFTIFSQRNTIVLLLLGFASGLPLALTTGTLQAWITVKDLDLETIGIFSLVGQAYIFKFLWSPMMDRYTPPFLGRRRGWLILTQLLLAISIFAMGYMDPTQHIYWLAALAVLIAFVSASQDIVFDAYKTDLLNATERGYGAAVSVFGYRLAMLISGGLALWLADRYLGWQRTYWLMAGLMLIGVITTLLAPEPVNPQPAPRTIKLAVIDPLKDFFGRNNAWLILLLIIMYKMGDAFAGSLSTTFLIRGIHFDIGEVGLVNKTLGLFATIVGALLGGVMMQRLSLFRALMFFGILQAVSNMGYWILAVTDKHLYSMGAAIFLENLCGGMGTAAFVALLMTLCNRSFSATQFALLSALSAIGRVYVGPIAGWFVAAYGWSWFYIFSIFAALPGLVLLVLCRQTLEYTQRTNSFMPRIHYALAYRWALRLLLTGIVLLILWLLMLMTNALGFTQLTLLPRKIIEAGVLIGGLGIGWGCLLDFCSLRQKQPN